MNIIRTVELFNERCHINGLPNVRFRYAGLFFKFAIGTFDIGFVDVSATLWKSPFRCVIECRFLPEKVGKSKFASLILNTFA